MFIDLNFKKKCNDKVEEIIYFFTEMIIDSILVTLKEMHDDRHIYIQQHFEEDEPF